MSHIVEAKTSIKNPDAALLRQAVELVAQQHSGRIQEYYLTYGRQRKRARLAIHTDEIFRGIGVVVAEEGGALTFVGDPYGYEDAAEALQQQILQTYVSLATMQALAALGYQTTAEDGESGRVILTGVSYA
jgi:hypothetical protein